MTVAAVNGPASTVISGPPDHVNAVVGAAQAAELRARMIEVDYASHGPQVEEIRDALAEALAGIGPARADVAFYSTVTGGRIDTAELDADYWFTNLRRPVRFADAVRALLADGHRVFVEASPHPVLTLGVQECCEQTGVDAVTVPTLRRDEGGPVQLARAAAQAYAAGVTVDWTRWFPAGARVVDLPTYAFQRERYWLEGDGVGDVGAAGIERVGHALLPAAVDLADGGLVLTGRLTASGWLTEHAVGDVPLLPGAALVEWALRAADETGCGGVEELTLRAPLLLPETGGLRVQVVAGPAADDGRRDVRINSRRDDDTAWTEHAAGVLAPEPDRAEGLSGAWPPAGAEPVDVTDFYARAAAGGYGYGPAFQGLRAAWRHGPDLLAEVALPEGTAAPGGFGIHPALLDATLHAAALLDRPEAGGERVWLPFAWSGVSLWATEASTVRVRLTPHDDDNGAGRGLRLLVADAGGAPVLGAASVVLRPAAADRLRHTPAADGLFTLDWVPATAGEAGTAPSLAAIGPEGYADLRALVAALDDGAPVPSAVLTRVPATGGLDAAAGLAATRDLLALARDWLAEPRLADARLVVITRGATDGTDAGAAGAWGLIRSAQSENPDRFVLLDLDRDEEDDVRLALTTGEPQVAVRDETILVPRLVRTGGGELTAPPGENAWRLAMESGGTVDDIAAVACPDVLEPLAEGQVRIAVRFAGVNFRDVLIALGMYPGGGVFRGSEGAGVVVATGPGVDLSVGDRVMGLFEGAFGPFAVADARMVAPMPDGWSFEDAAAVPVVFLTAWYGLVDLGGLQSGESVLVHAGTGGVGMAAIQIARHLGAEVWATASPAKHAVLEEMGIDSAHRASSRDLEFEERFRAATGGVDVVLNSLAGEYVDASLRLLGKGGRLVEMGKTDVRDAEQVAADHDGVRYRAFDLVGDAGPDRVGEMLRTLIALFAEGGLTPPPVRVWPLGQARRALRELGQARHTGKFVLEIPAPVDPGGTVLITGGTGTLGGLVAEHLARTRRLKHLVLVSRRGPDAPGASELAGRLADLGADARIVAADLADPAAVRDLVGAIDPPLTGIVHATGVLDDAVLASQTPERLARVWDAKATVAANLHEATAGLRLGMFVIFSSAAGTLGGAAQANYAAANAFCDALAAGRRAAGLPAVSVAWGLWADASGMTGHLGDADLARMSRTGIKPMSNEQGLALLDAATGHGAAYLLAADVDVRALSGQPVPPPLRALAGGPARRTAAASGGVPVDWAARLGGLSAADRHRALATLVRTHAATVLGHAGAEAVPADASFKELGFDSLAAVELRNRLSAATDLRLPAAVVFDYPDAGALAGHLLRRLSPEDAAPANAADPVLGELARIESTVLALDAEDRARIAKRLSGLLSALNGGSGETAGGPDFSALESASDDEIFELIDRELP